MIPEWPCVGGRHTPALFILKVHTFAVISNEVMVAENRQFPCSVTVYVEHILHLDREPTKDKGVCKQLYMYSAGPMFASKQLLQPKSV